MNLQQGSSLIFLALICGVAANKMSAYAMPKAAQTLVDAKCPDLARCSKWTYMNMFGSYDYADGMVKMFNDVLNSIADRDELRTRKVWTAYVDNVTLCAHLAPVRGKGKGLGLGPRKQQDKDESPFFNKPLLGSKLDDQLKMKGQDQMDELKDDKRQPEVGDIKSPIPLPNHLKSFDPTHPLTRDLKAAIEGVLSKHSTAIIEKLNITGEEYSVDELRKQLTLIDKCVLEHKANKAHNIAWGEWKTKMGKGLETGDDPKTMKPKTGDARKPKGKGSKAALDDAIAKHRKELTHKGLTGTGNTIVTTSLLIPVALFLIRLC